MNNNNLGGDVNDNEKKPSELTDEEIKERIKAQKEAGTGLDIRSIEEVEK